MRDIEKQRRYQREYNRQPHVREKNVMRDNERRRRMTLQQAGERVVVLGKIVEFCQMQAIECESAHEERGWLWAARWARTQQDKEQAKLTGEDPRVGAR